MRLEHAAAADKGWAVGAWNSGPPLSIGCATHTINAPHAHGQIIEI